MSNYAKTYRCLRGEYIIHAYILSVILFHVTLPFKFYSKLRFYITVIYILAYNWHLAGSSEISRREASPCNKQPLLVWIWCAHLSNCNVSFALFLKLICFSSLEWFQTPIFTFKTFGILPQQNSISLGKQQSHIQSHTHTYTHH